MNQQHKGANVQMLLQLEAAFRTAPAVPTAFRIPFTEAQVFSDPRRTNDPSISNSPLKAPDTCGDAVVDGATLQSILDLRTIGYHLKQLLGAPTVYKAVTKQPTNVTGVTIHYANAAATSGVGTLTWVFATNLLNWQANGDTAGATVNVSAGGQFTLQSGTANKEIYVTVLASALPGTNKNDADIAVSATLKAHAFPITLDDKPTALVEFGHMDSGNNKFYRYLGWFVKKLSYAIVGVEQNISLEIGAGEEVTPMPGAVWDAAPTAVAAVRACGHAATITDGANGLGVVTEGGIEVMNGVQGVSVADGKEGFGHLDGSELGIGGQIKVIFNSQGAYDMARTNASTRMLIQSKGLDSAGNEFKLVWDLPGVQFKPKAVPKSGKSGLFADLDWSAHRVVNGQLPKVYLVNDIASF